jgi:hypothetical protein
MSETIDKLVRLLTNPRQFYEDVRSEGAKSSFVFFLWVMLFLSAVTPVVNHFGVESTDLSSSCQAQIAAYNFMKNNLPETHGIIAYLAEAVLIFAFAFPILLLSTLFLHLIYKAIGGQGSILNGWKAMCYGLGPCLLGGFLPYISLFVAFYSFSIQFYLGPMTLYRAKEGRAIAVFAALIALSFIEMFVLGTTVSFG